MNEYVKIKSGAQSAKMLCREWKQFVELAKQEESPGDGWYLVEKSPNKPILAADEELAFAYDIHDGIASKTYFAVKKGTSFMPRIFSKLKIVAALIKSGIWEQVKQLIIDQGLWDLFNAAQEFQEGNEFFDDGITMLKEQLQWTDEQTEALLSQCIKD